MSEACSLLNQLMLEHEIDDEADKDKEQTRAGVLCIRSLTNTQNTFE